MPLPDHTAPIVLSVAKLSKRFHTTIAVEEVSFQVRRGEIVGLLGPNGAGKSTTINMLLGVLAPSSGTIEVNGIDTARHRSQALERVNFAAVYAPLPGNLTVRENLRVFGMLYEVRNLEQKIEELLTHFELDSFRNTRCGLLSSGEQTRVSLAKALVNTPDLLLLDEPTASLDPATAEDIRRRICSFVQHHNSAVLWTSHNMYEVESVCDRVLFLSKGRVLLDGDPKQLPKEHGKESLEQLFIAIARQPLSLERSILDAP